MNQYFIIMSFELHQRQLENWKTLSKEIDIDIAKADGFISRDSGIDEDGRVYCLVKWQSKTQQETFRRQLEAGNNWGDMMTKFASIANMETATNQQITIF